MNVKEAMSMVCPFTIGSGGSGGAMICQPCRVGQCMAWRWFTQDDHEIAQMAEMKREGGYCGRIGKEGAE